MPTFHMSLLRESAQPNEALEASGLFGAVWPLQGRVSINDSAHEEGTAAFLQGWSQITARDEGASWLRFALTEDPVVAPGLLHSAPIEVEAELVLLRLDTVTFPPGASAWRHVHPGPGIRHLLQGELTLQSDDHTKVVQAGDSWFEPAETPVKATASETEAKSGFVRFMVLPTQYLGQPTIRILDPEDAEKPRLQVTHRHIDHIVRLPQG